MALSIMLVGQVFVSSGAFQENVYAVDNSSTSSDEIIYSSAVMEATA